MIVVVNANDSGKVKFGFIEEDAPRGTFAKVPLGTPQNFWKKF
jgi:hypothetical protein